MMNNNNMLMNDYNVPELRQAGCGDLCESCLCPCYVFGKMISHLKMSEWNRVDRTACVSWALFVLLFWGGISAGVQLMVAQTGGSAQYAVYGLYALYVLVYLFPFLQVMPIYRALKWIQSNNNSTSGMAQEAPEPCHQYCIFIACPCAYLASASAHIKHAHGNGVQIGMVDQNTMACPLTCGGNYNLQVVYGGAQQALIPQPFGGSMNFTGSLAPPPYGYSPY